MKALNLAWKNVLRNRRRASVTILITAVGCAAILLAGGFALYTYGALEDGAAREFGHLTIAGKHAFERDEETPLQHGLDNSQTLTAQLEQDPRVRRVLPRIALSGLISNGDKSMIFMGTGVDIRAEAAVRGPFLSLLAGRLGTGNPAEPQVLLGSDLARSLGAQPGSGLTLLSTTVTGAMNAVDVQVAGIVSTGWRELDKRQVYTDLATAQRLLASQRVSSLSVYLEDTALTAPFLNERQSADPQHDTQAWWQQAFYYDAVRALYNRIFGLLGLIIAALVFFSVANTLAMAVVERTREIGTLRALGALPREIITQFVREGALIGLIGCGLGTMVTVLLILLLPILGLEMPPPPGRSAGYPLQVNFSPMLTCLTNAALILLCALAARIVSSKVAHKPIVEALSHV